MTAQGRGCVKTLDLVFCRVEIRGDQSEIAPVGHGGDLLAARGLLCLERHGRKLVAVVPLIGHLVSYDQILLGVGWDSISGARRIAPDR